MSEFFRTQMGRKLIDASPFTLEEKQILLETTSLNERKNKLEEKKFLLEERIQRLTIKEAKKNG